LPGRGEAVEVEAAGKDGDAEWLAAPEWVQIPNPYNQTISGNQEAHIAHTARDRIKTFRADKAETAEVSRAEARLCRVEAEEVSRTEARLCRVEAARVEVQHPRAGE
jgi:hypothetical protein